MWVPINVKTGVGQTGKKRKEHGGMTLEILCQCLGSPAGGVARRVLQGSVLLPAQRSPF